MWCGALAIAGYFLPTLAMKRRIAQRALQHRMGFPDFMDLMVVCAEAGLSMEAAIERIARELVDGYPSLAENLYMGSLEIRAGKTFSEAFERLGERLGIEEAMMLATLLQQSAELGTSLSNSLRVYSDEMRSKRLVPRRGEGLLAAREAYGSVNPFRLSCAPLRADAARRHPHLGRGLGRLAGDR